MAISPQDAADSLSLIRETAGRTRRAISAGYAANLLILWGAVWVAGFAAVHSWGHWGGWVFAALDGLGIVGSAFLCRHWPSRISVTGRSVTRTGRRMIAFWLALFVYAGLWILLFRPAGGMLLGTFLVTVVMLGYVAVGLWSGSSFMVVLGLAVTGLAFLGYYVFPEYLNLWMAGLGGGTLLGTGLYIRIRWR